MQHDRPHALVVGASLAGMLAARVLSETCERVRCSTGTCGPTTRGPARGSRTAGTPTGSCRVASPASRRSSGLTAELVRAGGSSATSPTAWPGPSRAAGSRPHPATWSVSW